MTQPSDDVIRARFARFIERSLSAARTRGMSDKTIEQATGVMSSTFHRWRRGEVRTTPELPKVRAFCEGVGADIGEAMTALGITGQRDTPEPEPQLNPDMRVILRRLNDPSVPAAEKAIISEFLRMLAERHGEAR